MTGAGARDRAVTVEQMTEGTDASGDPTESWTTLVTTYWCHRADAAGRERFVADQLSAPFHTRWEGAYRPDLDPELVDVAKVRRLVAEGRAYDIVSASVVGRRRAIAFVTLARQG